MKRGFFWRHLSAFVMCYKNNSVRWKGTALCYQTVTRRDLGVCVFSHELKHSSMCEFELVCFNFSSTLHRCTMEQCHWITFKSKSLHTHTPWIRVNIFEWMPNSQSTFLDHLNINSLCNSWPMYHALLHSCLCTLSAILTIAKVKTLYYRSLKYRMIYSVEMSSKIIFCSQHFRVF